MKESDGFKIVLHTKLLQKLITENKPNCKLRIVETDEVDKTFNECK